MQVWKNNKNVIVKNLINKELHFFNLIYIAKQKLYILYGSFYWVSYIDSIIHTSFLLDIDQH